MFKKACIATLMLSVVALSAQAEDAGGYVAVSVGQAKAEQPKPIKEGGNIFKATGGNVSSDRESTAFKLTLGLNSNPYMALEAQYIDLGESRYKGASVVPASALDIKTDLETKGWGINLVGTLPLADFGLFAKAGYHQLKTTIKVASPVPGHSRSQTARKWSPSFAVGAKYNITTAFTVLIEYERYMGVADKKIDNRNMKHDIDMASLGLRYNF